MNPTNAPLTERRESDVFDELERALLELTTAHLDEAPAAPIVDEFAIDFL